MNYNSCFTNDDHELLFEKAAIGVAVVSKERKYLKVNSSFCKMLGYNEEELLKMNVSDITHPDDMKTNIKLDDEVLHQNRSHFSMEKRYIRKDGSEFWVLLTVTLAILEEGGEEVFLSQVQDISAQKELAELKRFEAMNALVVTYNHEINNPLMVAMSTVERILEKEKFSREEMRILTSNLKRIQVVVAKIREAISPGRLVLDNYAENHKLIKLNKSS